MSYRLSKHLFLLLSILMVFGSCNAIRRPYTTDSLTAEKLQGNIYALKNVNIIPMTAGNKIIKNGTVVIKDKKIFSINQPVPDKANVIV